MGISGGKSRGVGQTGDAIISAADECTERAIKRHGARSRQQQICVDVAREITSAREEFETKQQSHLTKTTPYHAGQFRRYVLDASAALARSQPQRARTLLANARRHDIPETNIQAKKCKRVAKGRPGKCDEAARKIAEVRDEAAGKPPEKVCTQFEPSIGDAARALEAGRAGDAMALASGARLFTSGDCKTDAELDAAFAQLIAPSAEDTSAPDAEPPTEAPRVCSATSSDMSVCDMVEGSSISVADLIFVHNVDIVTGTVPEGAKRIRFMVEGNDGNYYVIFQDELVIHKLDFPVGLGQRIFESLANLIQGDGSARSHLVEWLRHSSDKNFSEDDIRKIDRWLARTKDFISVDELHAQLSEDE